MIQPFGSFLSVSVSVSYSCRPSVLRDLSLEMGRGEILGLAGGSGSGKSTLALAMMNLLERPRATVSGHVYFKGYDLLAMTESELRKVRGREISLVLQSPAAALNPMLRLGTQLREAWRAHASDDGTSEIAHALESVSLPSDASFLKRYPAQISTGQGQRLLIAMAILHRPALLIADEPTSALDPITQDEILELLKDCNRRSGTAVLLISHDLSALRSTCDRVAILHQGGIVECDNVDRILTRPNHAFTKRLTQNARSHATAKP